MATTEKKSSGKTSKSPRKKAAKKNDKNKLGVKNSLVNNINAKVNGFKKSLPGYEK